MKLDSDDFVIAFDPGQTNPETLIEVIREAGYKSSVVANRPDSRPTGSEASQVASDSDNPPAGQDQLDQARQKARAENKLLVIDFMASWCAPCKRMEAETFQDPRVAPLLQESAVLLKVDTDEYPEIAKRFGVNSLPDVRILDASGTELRRLMNFQDAAAFSAALQQALNTARGGSTPSSGKP